MKYALLFIFLLNNLAAFSMNQDSLSYSSVDRVAARRTLVACLRAMPNDLSQEAQAREISRCLFIKDSTQPPVEQLLLATILHKNPRTNPFRGMKGPRTTADFGFGHYAFGLAVNIDLANLHEMNLPHGLLDLVIVNWVDAVPAFFEQIFTFDGKPIYLVTDIPIKDVYSSASAAMGQIGRKWNPVSPEPVCEKVTTIWNHLFSPRGELKDMVIFRADEQICTIDCAVFFLHETYHCFEGRNLKAQDYIARLRLDHQERQKSIADAIATFYASKEQQNLIYAYGEVILKLTNPDSSTRERESLLVILNTLIMRIKSQNQFLWDKFTFFEYEEGVAEYVAIQSLKDAGFITSADAHAIQKGGINASFYGTGALGMTFIVDTFGGYEWTNSPRIPNESIWEIYLRLAEIQATDDALRDEFLTTLDVRAIEDVVRKMKHYLESPINIHEYEEKPKQPGVFCWLF